MKEYNIKVKDFLTIGVEAKTFQEAINTAINHLRDIAGITVSEDMIQSITVKESDTAE